MLKATLLGLVSAVVVGAPFIVQQPADAQYWHDDWRGNSNWRGHHYGWGQGIDQRQRMLLDQLNRGRTSGRLTAAEYNQLFNRYNNIADLEAQFRAGGLSFSERQRLMNRLNNLNFSLRRDLYDNQYAGRWHRWF